MKAKRSQRLGVYAGSFDPLTIGHLWMIQEGARLFEQLIVAVGVNPDKKSQFSVDERLAMLRESCRPFHNVSVASFSNLYLIEIRAEYSWVEQTLFAAKRSEILEYFLARRRIYNNILFFDRFEVKARENLRASIRKLRSSRDS